MAMAMRRPQGQLKNCKACFKVFVSMGGEEYCPACLPEAAAQEKKLRDYLRDNPGKPLIDVLKEVRASEEMGNSHAVEDFMFTEGLVEGVPHQNVCASCGAPISDGLVYCRDCFQSWLKTVKSTRPTELPEFAAHAPRDSDRAAPVDVAALATAAMYGTSRPNQPHGPSGSKYHSSDDKKRAQHYIGIIDPRTPRREK